MSDILKRENIAIFDWDDTLFPSRYFLEVHKREVEKTGIIPLWVKDFEKSILDILDLAISSCSKVYIVTNAGHEWINYCKSIITGMEEKLKIVNIYHALEEHREKYSVSHCKFVAFDHIYRNFATEKDTIYSILSMGDSPNDREATIYLSKYPNVIVKNVKFTELPCPKELLYEHENLISNFSFLVKHEYELDVQLESAFPDDLEKLEAEVDKFYELFCSDSDSE